MLLSLVSPQARRGLAVAFLGGLLTCLAGCDRDGYPAEMAYPLRSDPLITEGLTTEPRTTDRPGELPRLLSLYLAKEEQDRKLFDVNGLKADQRTVLEKTLNEVFGTPAQPTVQEISDDTRKSLRLDGPTLQEGSRLYRQHCLHCHGLTGDGRGPTAAWVNPHPRDYRKGFFKFTSSSATVAQRRARRADLIRVLRDGIEDSSMPSFRLLADEDQEAIVSYVIHLSLRGQVEAFIMDQVRQERMKTAEIADEVKGITVAFAGNWTATEKQAIQPVGLHTPLTPFTEEAKQSVQRGMDLFLKKDDPKGGASAGCASCHLDFGRAGTYRFDDWGTIHRPADLTRGVFRGGRRPIDLYYRIHSGLNGTAMPATSLKGETGKPDPIWDVVNFLQILPFPEKHAQYGVNVDTTVVSGSKGR